MQYEPEMRNEFDKNFNRPFPVLPFKTYER